VLTWEVAHLLTGQLRADLDRLLMYDAGMKMIRPAWLIKAATDAGATNQALERREEQRRYPILLAVVTQSAVDQIDEVVMLFDQAVSARESRAKSKTDEALIERAKAGEARQLLLDVILPVLADPAIPDEQIGGLLRNTIGMSKLREVVTEGWKKLPATETAGQRGGQFGVAGELRSDGGRARARGRGQGARRGERRTERDHLASVQIHVSCSERRCSCGRGCSRGRAGVWR
jgi:hypothetical protein